MKKSARVISLALLLTLLFPLITLAVSDYPEAIPGELYVQDFYDVLSEEQEQEIEMLGQNLENATSSQIVVMTVESLEGQDVATYAVDVMRGYGIGDEEKDNGVLFILEMDPNKVGNRDVYIGVGYGLEGALPDGKVGRILEEYTYPFLEQGDAPGLYFLLISFYITRLLQSMGGMESWQRHRSLLHLLALQAVDFPFLQSL